MGYLHCIKFDPFHAIQRVLTKIPKKGGSGPPQKLRTQMLHDFKLILRDPTDRRMERSKPTPSTSPIKKNIDNFLIQWKSVEYEGTKVIPQSAINEIEKLLVHVGKGCLSDIPPSVGTSRNEGIHKVLKKSRIGIQFALALLGIFFYIWNKKKITATEDQRRIRVTPPIESHFEHLESNQELSGNHHFGITDQDVVLPKTGDLVYLHIVVTMDMTTISEKLWNI